MLRLFRFSSRRKQRSVRWSSCKLTLTSFTDRSLLILKAFAAFLKAQLAKVSGAPVDADAWARASYHPTPTIVEAARALYAQHSVEAIARFDAGAQNLHVTSRRIEELVDEAQAKGRKRICFVTGVPGAGKTLVGLNLATRREENEPTHAVFLSGNGPLVAVLREALTRDEHRATKKTGGEGAKRGDW